MPSMLFDPPELAEYAERGDPPISEWPGTIRTEAGCDGGLRR